MILPWEPNPSTCFTRSLQEIKRENTAEFCSCIIILGKVLILQGVANGCVIYEKKFSCHSGKQIFFVTHELLNNTNVNYMF